MPRRGRANALYLRLHCEFCFGAADKDLIGRSPFISCFILIALTMHMWKVLREVAAMSYADSPRYCAVILRSLQRRISHCDLAPNVLAQLCLPVN